MGNRRHNEFAPTTIKKALARQKSHCASCGTRIWALGARGAALHKHGERAEAHHVIPVSAGGTARVDNCVILCGSCHYSAHQAGRWADNSIY
jgi:5-methylcytosine-specific restriction endonuclease McrA